MATALLDFPQQTCYIVGVNELCKHEGCSRSSVARGMCHKHYKQWWRPGGDGSIRRLAPRGSGYAHRGRQVRQVTVAGKKTIRMVHREIVERALTRSLTQDEVVHHVDGDGFNNCLTNLQVMSRSEHSKLHHPPRPMDEAKMVRLREEGLSLRAIGRVLGVTKDTIKKRLREHVLD